MIFGRYEFTTKKLAGTTIIHDSSAISPTTTIHTKTETPSTILPQNGKKGNRPNGK
jgi:hypothetical protein